MNKCFAVACLLLVLPACSATRRTVLGEEVPPWAQVSPEQIVAARTHGVPVAFENDLGMRFVLIPGGTFLMGSPLDEAGRDEDEGPQREVTVAPLYMAVTEVTTAQYRNFRPSHTIRSTPGRRRNANRMPVADVSHHDATAFAAWLSARRDGRSYRLPSEAEWEYACRAGSTTPWSFGSDEELLRQYAWYHGETLGAHPVGMLKPNDWGLHDMHGNVREWCQDRWTWSYEGARSDGLPWLEVVPGSDNFVCRGGSGGAPASRVRSADRVSLGPDNRLGMLGLRLVSPLTEVR